MTNATRTKKTTTARQNATKKVRSQKKNTTEKKAVIKEAVAEQKKMPGRKHKIAANRRSASSSRQALESKLKQDMKATKKALKSMRAAARDEIKLAKAAAKDEIASLKDQLAEVLKREKALVKMSQEKTRKMIAAGERWERKQLNKIKKATARVRNK